MKKLYRRSISGLMALLICFTTILGGGITAFAASSSGEVAKSYSIGFPRSGDANLDYSGTWGHDELHYMNGWTSGEATWMTTLHTIGSFDGPACYCIEPGVPRLLEKTYTRYGEDYWKNYPSDYNSTIDADTIKTLLGRIMQYGYQGDLSLDWRSQNEADADKMAHMMATQVLVWETVVGERDANFNHVDPGSADAVKSVYRTSHPLYSRFSAYYDSIEASVQSHTVIPSFMSKTPNKAQTVELKWDGSQYTATLTDSNHVVSNYTFSSNLSDIVFTTNGDTLTITAKTAPAEPLTISASKNNIRKGVVVWSDGHYGPDGTMQDAVTYAATVMDPVQAFLNLKVSYGSAKIIKTSEDGKVDNLTFTVTGNGVNQTVKTNAKGEIQIDNLMPGVYTVTEMDYDKYEPQESRRVTVVSGQVSTVTFNNKLKRGDLQIVKSSEDNLNEGVTFHLYGTSLSGIAVDEYAVTDANGVATFEDVLISGSTPYTVEEVDTAIRYVVPEAQSAPINWNEVTNRSFLNILKKFSVTVTKSDAETGTVQGDASLAGAVYGIYKGETLVDTYTTDKNGQFVTKEYICDNDWTVREITPSEGYLLDTTVHKVGAEPQLYTVEHNQTANDVTEQVAKGNIAIIKHTDNGDTQIETPENGAEFAVHLKAAGSYEVAEDTERDFLTCDENGFAQTKDMPYGIYTVHQVSGWEGSKLMPDFDVFISQNGATYRYLINNAPFNSFIKIVKQDAETGKTMAHPPKIDREYIAELSKKYLGFELNEEFFCVGGLKECSSLLPLGNSSLEGTDMEKTKYNLIQTLDSKLAQIDLRQMYIQVFSNVAIIPLAVFNCSAKKDERISISLTVCNGIPIEPTAKFVSSDCEGLEGCVYDEHLAKEILKLPEDGRIKYDTSLSQESALPYIPAFHPPLIDPFGRTIIPESDAEDYAQELQEYVQGTDGGTGREYSFTIGALRPKEVLWLDRVLLIKPVEGRIIISYKIKSNNTTGDLTGELIYETEGNGCLAMV